MYVSSMISSARVIVQPVTITMLTSNLFYFAGFLKRCDGQTDTTCENSYHYLLAYCGLAAWINKICR